jgi:tetratricopeptide (TPR) repeat protein/DNA-binding winged helix-turn-helix (wHTH) protein
MNRQNHRIYRLDDIEIDAARACLRRDGQERHLRQKTFQVLLYLLEQRERLVTRDELIEHAWADTAVTDNALEQCLAEIRKVLGDDSRHPRFIKTVPRAGYRFIGTIEEIDLADEVKQSAGSPALAAGESIGAIPGIAQSPAARRALLIAVALVLVGGAVAAIYVIQKRRAQSQAHSNITLPQTPGKRPVAVMFFDNQSGSADLDWLREGLADMLITGLSRSKNLTILSRQQLRTLLDRAGRPATDRIPLEEALVIGQKSKATIVITGSFARLGDQIRIDAQLHDARDGQLLAAERLVVDRPAEILTQVDLLSLKLASHLGAPQQPANENLVSVMTNDLAAYRYYSLGVEKAQAVENQEAIALLEKAIALDSDFAMAYARIGYTYVMSWGRSEEGKPYLEKAFKLTERLSEKDRLNIAAWYAVANQDYSAAIRSFQEIIVRYPLEVESYHLLGGLLRGENRPHEAIEILKQGLVIDSEAGELYNRLGANYSDLGRHDEAISMFQRYVRLSPDEPNSHDSLGMGYQWAGRYPEAIQEYERALMLKPDFYISIIHLANTLYQTGRYREALEQFQRYLKIVPSNAERSRGLNAIAHVQRSKGRLVEAERAARQAMARDPSTFDQLLEVVLEKGDLSGAENLAQRLEQSRLKGRGARGESRFNLYYQGRLELKRGRATEAIAKFKEALQNRPPIWNLDAFEGCLANAYLELGRLDEAVAEYERVLRLNPNYPLAHYHLAQAYERKGQPAQALTAYERFLQVWKDADGDLPELIAARNHLSKSSKATSDQ